MRKFTCGSASGSTAKAESAQDTQTFAVEGLPKAEHYNRLEQESSNPSLRPAQNVLGLVRDAVSRLCSYSAARASFITTSVFSASLPFPWRRLRNTLLRSCGSSRKGIAQ
jgi:hypothetical protein